MKWTHPITGKQTSGDLFIMTTTQSTADLPPGAQNKSHHGSGDGDAATAVIRDILQTREVRQLLITLGPEFLDMWAENSWWKNKVSILTGRVIENQLSRPEDALAKKELPLLFKNERFVRHLLELLPEVINTLTDAAGTAGATLEALTPDEKKTLLGDLLSKACTGQSGEILTVLLRVLNHIHEEDPEFLTQALAPGFKKWFESVDFGELKEAVNKAGPDARALVEMINHTIWEYPAKVVLLLSLLPSLMNGAAAALEISVGGLNALPPDLLADVTLSFLQEVDGKAVGGLVNELAEVVRKLTTGSALIGEPGAPQLPKVLSAKLDEIVGQSDPVGLFKARVGVAQIKDDIRQAVSDAAAKNPEFVRLNLMGGAEIFNIHIRSINRNLSMWEETDDDALSGSMLQLLSSCDVQEAAEVLNTTLRIAGRVWDKEPAACIEFIRQAAEAIDHDEMAYTVKGVLEDAGDALKPAARTIVPGLVNWVCDVLQPEDDEYEEDAAKARKALRSLLMAEEI